MYFKDIIGQEEIKERLRQSAVSGIVPHAQLFAGKTGYGSFALAIAYAQYLNCANRTDTDSCGHCNSCRMFEALAHPDLLFTFPYIKREKEKKTICNDYINEWRKFAKEDPYLKYDRWLDALDAGNSQPIIYSNESDEIIRKLSFQEYNARYRAMIIWMPEKMHEACANSLLKTIEEPPKNTVIIMISDKPELVLGTIYSRSQLIQIPPIADADMVSKLTGDYHIERDEAAKITHIAQGDWNEALRILSTHDEDKEYLEYFKMFMRYSWKRDVKALKEEADKLSDMGRERQKHFLQYCQQLIRENFIYNLHDNRLNYMNVAETQFSVKFSPFVNERNVMDIMDELATAENDITQNVYSKMVFFDLFLHISVLIRK